MDRRQFTLSTLATFASQTVAQEIPTPLKVAVIGHTGRGDYGHGLDTVWQRNGRTSIVAVADANEVGLAKAATRLKLDSAASFGDYRQMLTKVRPDIVAICPRHVDQHHDMIMAAIESGAKGIYVEKPFLRTPAECDRVLAAAEKHGTRIAIAHRNRYHPVMQIVADLIKDGRIGRLLEIRGRGKGDRRGGGEDLWVLGSHVLNMVNFLAGNPISCSAEMLQDGRRVKPGDVHKGAEGLGPLAGNELHARFMLDSGITVYFDSIANDQTENRGFGLQLIGSKGIISMRTDRDPLAHLIPGNPFEPTDKPRPWLPISTGGVNVAEPNPKLIDHIFHHDTAVADLIAAIDEDRQPLCSAAEGALTVEMICSVFQSHREGKTVTFPLQQREHPLMNYSAK
jgi:predicted dehydrogenase